MAEAQGHRKAGSRAPTPRTPCFSDNHGRVRGRGEAVRTLASQKTEVQVAPGRQLPSLNLSLRLCTTGRSDTYSYTSGPPFLQGQMRAK